MVSGLPRSSGPAARRAPAIWLCATLAACATGQVPTANAPGSGYAGDAEERQLIREADEYERELDAQGLVLEDPALQAYIDGVAAKLVPTNLPTSMRFRFHVLREPTMNAFALPQGALQLHLGLLARLQNEAQLAHVLGHEITHTVNRHQFRFVCNLQNKTVAAKVASMAIIPAAVFFGGGAAASLAGQLLQLTYAAAVTGYGRDMEEEADREAIVRIARAGYPVEEAPRVFEVLNEVEEAGALETFFYGSHPSNAARAAYTRQLIARGEVSSLAGASTNVEAYREATRAVALDNVRLRLRAKHYDYARQEAEAALASRGDDPWLHYYMGEAHRLTAEDPRGAAREQAFRKREQPDDDLVESFEKRAPAERSEAEGSYQRALELDPSLALAHRGLGLVAQERGDAENARRELHVFLQGNPSLQERLYVERVLEEIGP